MKASIGFKASTFAAALLTLGAVSPAHAVPMILNGGFESGLASWTKADQLGSEGTFALQSGTVSPVNGDPVPTPPGGTFAAMTDAQGPGSHVLFQDFVVTPGSATISFALFIGNRGNSFFTPSPASLDFSTPALNQQARVDILKGGTNAFSVAAADVLLNLFQTNPGDPLVSGYTTHGVDVSALFAAHIGETLRLRFAEVDNVFTFQLGVDNVSINPTAATVPEPSSTLLFGAALMLLASRFGVRSRRPRL
ncbi:MAG TPA: PEP-CTERM sorting domain-containing protein [Burkholderiales bacterium]|nr:PEP-CTERM sorting domain-containing protein [Burkholderiales bacterium]